MRCLCLQLWVVVARRVRYESRTPIKLMKALRIPKLSAIAVSRDTGMKIISMKKRWDDSTRMLGKGKSRWASEGRGKIV